jgi:hypothetical protein
VTLYHVYSDYKLFLKVCDVLSRTLTLWVNVVQFDTSCGGGDTCLVYT